MGEYAVLIKKKFKERLRQWRLRLLPQQVFYVILAEGQHDSYEDPRCPWDWRGSGCYDIDLYNWKYTYYAVCARDLIEARELMEKEISDEYDRIYAKYLKKFKDEGSSIAEWAARNRALEQSHNGAEIIGILSSKEDPYSMNIFDVEGVDSVETEWSEREEDNDVGEAIYALDIQKMVLT